MDTTTKNIFERYTNPTYLVYRKNIRKGCLIPEGMLSGCLTGTIEPDDITETPLTKEEAKAYIQHFNPEMKKGTLDKLVKSYDLQKHRLDGYNGYVYLRSEVREAVARSKEAQQLLK